MFEEQELPALQELSRRPRNETLFADAHTVGGISIPPHYHLEGGLVSRTFLGVLAENSLRIVNNPKYLSKHYFLIIELLICFRGVFWGVFWGGCRHFL